MGEYYKSGATEEETWKEIQEHNGLSDAQIEAFKNNPRRRHFMPKLASEDIRDWTMVVEVVDVNCCANGMEVGDKLYYKDGCMILDSDRSSQTGWCAHAMNTISTYCTLFRNLLLAGIEDPNMCVYEPFSACVDIDTVRSWGQVTLKFWCFKESLGETYKDWGTPEFED